MKNPLTRRNAMKLFGGAAVAATQGNAKGSPVTLPNGTIFGQPPGGYDVSQTSKLDPIMEAQFRALKREHLEKMANGEFTKAQLAAMSSSTVQYIGDLNIEALKSVSHVGRELIKREQYMTRLKAQYIKYAKQQLKSLLFPKEWNQIEHFKKNLKKELPYGEDTYDDD